MPSFKRGVAESLRPDKKADPDFLALVFLFGGASCFGRGKTKGDAVRICTVEAMDTIKALGLKPKPGAEIKINVFDLSDTGIDQVTWSGGGEIEADGKPMTIKPTVLQVPV